MGLRPIGGARPIAAPLSGGGGHGGGGHHGGGRGRGWGGPGWWGGGPWYGEYGPIVLVADSGCPTTYAPVMGTDGTIYQNACVANARGVGVLRAMPGQARPYGMSGVEEDLGFSVSIDDQDQTQGAKLGFWVGVAVGSIAPVLLASLLRPLIR